MALVAFGGAVTGGRRNVVGGVLVALLLLAHMIFLCDWGVSRFADDQGAVIASVGQWSEAEVMSASESVPVSCGECCVAAVPQRATVWRLALEPIVPVDVVAGNGVPVASGPPGTGVRACDGRTILQGLCVDRC